MANAIEEQTVQKDIFQKTLLQLDCLKSVQVQPESQERLSREIAAIEQTIRLLMNGNAIENAETLDILTQQYEAALATLRAGNLAAFEPSLDAVQGAFSAEQQQAFSQLKQPTLLLVPQGSFASKVRAIDQSSLAPYKTYVNQNVFGSSEQDPNDQKATAVRPVVIEGMQDMSLSPKDNSGNRLRDRIAAVRKGRPASVGGTDRDQYATLMLHALRNGNPVDRRTWTVLDGDKALQGNTVPYGLWDVDLVYFDRHLAVIPHETARFRSSVGGDVIGS